MQDYKKEIRMEIGMEIMILMQLQNKKLTGTPMGFQKEIGMGILTATEMEKHLDSSSDLNLDLKKEILTDLNWVITKEIDLDLMTD
jgi:hypothetical protein